MFTPWSEDDGGNSNQQRPIYKRERDEGSESEPNIAALGNASAKCKENLAFTTPNVTASENSKLKYCKFFCNTATVQFYRRIALSIIVKPKTMFYSLPLSF